jgi:uncharacterized protein (DUF924 family)
VRYAAPIPGADPRPVEILRFWFGPDLLCVPRVLQKRWFAKDAALDAEVLTRFVAVYREALAGHLESWRQGPLCCLALVILLDQFPRNMFRGTSKAFASDHLALAAAQGGVARGFDREVPPLARAFYYLPFEHSENLADQDECARLLAQWHDVPELATFADYARRHREVIVRFGRFPHRNEMLARQSTSEERLFLQQPGSSF